MTKESNSPIPEEFLEWAKSYAYKLCSGVTYGMYEKAPKFCEEIAIAAYRHLTTSDKGAEAATGLEWVNVFDRLPDHELATVHCRTKYGRAINKFAEGKFWWLDSKEVWKLSENTTHWLDESPVSPRGEGGWLEVSAECCPETGYPFDAWINGRREANCGPYVGGGWDKGRISENMKLKGITYWMPLPSAPVKEGGTTP